MEIRKAIVLLSNVEENHGQSPPWEPKVPKSAWCLTCMLLSCSECNKVSHMCPLALVTSICRSWQPWKITNIFSALGLIVLLPSHTLRPSLHDLHSRPPELPIGHAWRMRSLGLLYNTKESKPLSTAHLLKVNRHHLSLFPPGKGKFCQLVPRVALLMHKLKRDTAEKGRGYLEDLCLSSSAWQGRLAALQIIVQMLHNERLIHVKPGHVKATSLSQLSKNPLAFTLHNAEWMYRQGQWLMPQHARSLFSWKTWKVRGVDSLCWVEVQIYHPWCLARGPVFDWWTNPQGRTEDGDEGLLLCALPCVFFF